MNKSAQQRMKIFDAMPRSVRDVVNYASVGIRLDQLMESPNNRKLLKETPEIFAERLTAKIEHTALTLENEKRIKT